MDPMLWELLAEGSPDDMVEVLVKLSRPEKTLPSSVYIVARIGDIVSCRIRRGDIETIRRHEAVFSMKGPRKITINWPYEETRRHDASVKDREEPNLIRRPDVSLTGKNVAIGIADSGIDVTHPSFCHPDGSSRFAAFWDQEAEYDGVNTYGYGAVYDQAEISSALSSEFPFRELRNHPGKSDIFEQGTHGCHVLGIAAGNDNAGAPGIAPDAVLVAVNLASEQYKDLMGLGDSVRLFDAVHFLDKSAASQPLVTVLCLGDHCGPNRGLSLIEQAVDYLSISKAGRTYVNSTGNYFLGRTHTGGKLSDGEQATLSWLIADQDKTPNEIDIWYEPTDEIRISLFDPAGNCLLDEQGIGRLDIRDTNGVLIGNFYHRDNEPSSGLNNAAIFLKGHAMPGKWKVRLYGTRIANGRYEAWIERDSRSGIHQSRFPFHQADSAMTTGSICNGYHNICVGAYDPTDPQKKVCSFSSAGPTWDGRSKPDLIAPGERILSAKSAAPDEDRSPGELTQKSGTSMAAPYVAGICALLYEASGTPISGEDMKRKVLLACRLPEHVDGQERQRYGNGVLDMELLFPEYLKKKSSNPTTQKNNMNHDDSNQHLPSLESLFEACEQQFPELKDGNLSAFFESLPSERTLANRFSFQQGDIIVRRQYGHHEEGWYGVVEGIEDKNVWVVSPKGRKQLNLQGSLPFFEVKKIFKKDIIPDSNDGLYEENFIDITNKYSENDDPKDDLLDPILKVNRKLIHEKNIKWWGTLNQDKINPLMPDDPFILPNRYANRVKKMQTFFNAQDLSKKIVGHYIDEDGILGPESLGILFRLWKHLIETTPAQFSKLEKFEKQYGILNIVKTLNEALSLLNPDEKNAMVNILIMSVVYKPKEMTRWQFTTTITPIAFFLLENDKSYYKQVPSGLARDGIFFSRNLTILINFIVNDIEEATHLNVTLTFEEKVEMLKLLYPIEKIPAIGVFFEVKRPFINDDLDTYWMNPKKNYPELFLIFTFKEPTYLNRVSPILNLQIPKNTKTEKALQGLKQNTSAKITGLTLYYYLPKPNRNNIQLSKEYIANQAMITNAGEAAAMEYLKQLQQEVNNRMAAPADIKDYQTLIDVLTQPVAKIKKPDEIRRLIQKAQDTHFLIVNFDKTAIQGSVNTKDTAIAMITSPLKGGGILNPIKDFSADKQVKSSGINPFLITYRQILSCHKAAVHNESSPLRMGNFKPQTNAINVDDVEFSTEVNDNKVIVRQTGIYEKNKYREYTSFTPVKVQVGVINPNAGFWTERWRQLAGDTDWSVQEYWHLSDMLPELEKQLKDYLDSVASAKGLDAIISILTAGVTLGLAPAAALAPSGGVIATTLVGREVTVIITKELLKRTFWYVITEILAQKFMDFDHKVNNDPNYSDDERSAWNAFKTGLLILGGTALLRQAWSGLKYLGSAVFKKSFLELEEELLRSGLAFKASSGTADVVVAARTRLVLSAREWAKKNLDLTTNTLKYIGEPAIQLLKQLPAWTLNLIRELNDSIKRALLGCRSNCKVNLDQIKKDILPSIHSKLEIPQLSGILASELHLLQILSFEAWDRVVQYAIQNSNVFSIKGKIAEEVFFLSDAFKKAWTNALERASKIGFTEADIQLVRNIKGVSPSSTATGAMQELTDGALVAVKGDKIFIFTVFEMKSPSNLRDLAKWEKEFLGQIGWDFERFAENPSLFGLGTGNRIFQPDQVVISRNNTAWIGVAPHGKTLSPANIKHIQDAMPGFELVNGPVRDGILNDLAKNVSKLRPTS